MKKNYKQETVVNKIYLDNEGKKYLRVKECGINIFRIMTTGIPISRFPDDKDTYIEMETLIDIYKKDMEESISPDTKKICQGNIEFLEKIKTN